jgi:hypothetical protein
MIDVGCSLPESSGGAAIRSAVRLFGSRSVPGVPRLPAALRLVDLPRALPAIDGQLAARRIHAKRLTSDRPIALALAPVSWLAALVRDSEHCHGIASNLVKDRVRKVTENISPDCILVFGAHQRTDTKPINGPKGLGSKSIGRNWAALKVPEECLSDFCLSLGQNLDYKASHRVLSLALASVQETAFTVPARRAACRDLISCRQASAIEESSLPSRLSSSATVKAARSAAGRPRASSRRWSTWAFMRQSLALRLGRVTACLEAMPNE